MVSRIGGPATLTVLTPPSITRGPQNVSASVGTAATFACVATGNPTPTIEWLDPSNTAIVNSSNYLVTGEGLTVTSVTRSDEGRFTCEAETRAGVARQHAFLNVQYPPEVLISEVTVIVVEGQATSLPCHLEGNPMTSFSWRRSGEDVLQQQNGRFTLSTSGTLQISSSAKTDEGSYQCTLTNLLGSASSTVQLRVQVPASIQSTSSPVAVVTGNPVSLSCEASGDPSPSVQWTRNGQPFPSLTVSSRVTVTNGNQTLTFSDTLKSDEGMYTCAATNSIRSDSDDVELVVYVPPTITTTSVSIEVVEGGSVVLDCVSSGDPAPRISWSRNGRPVVTNSNAVQYANGSLVLPSILEVEEGSYTCLAGNEGGNASLSHQVDVKVPAQAFLPPNTSLVSGRSGRIDCVVRGDPASSVSWFQPDSTMVTTSSLSRIRSLGNGTLSFSTVNPQDAGNYTCEVSNSLAVDSATVNLFVTVHPTATAAVDELRIVVDTNTTLGCATSGTPPPVVTWYKGSLPIEPTERISVTGSTLQIVTVTHDDGGSYRCEATNEVGTASDVVQLITLEPPTATTPSQLTLVARQPTTIACVTTGVPVPSVNWFGPDGSMLSNSATVSIATNGSLTISLAAQEDGGTFRCTATNEVGMATSSVAVTVHVPPTISIVTSEVTAVVRETARLECVANGNPPPIVTWTRNNAVLSDSRITQQSGVLIISSVALSDEGVYTCTASNLVGVAVGNISLVVHERPRIDASPSNQIIHVNQSVDFYCNATGKPTPQLSWLHNSTTISGAMQSSLSIAMATAGSEGTYTCTATNAAGLAVAMATLSILYPPDPPVLSSVIATSPTSLMVSWTTGGNGGSPITGFLVDYQTSSGSTVDTVTVSMSLATTATVTGLSPYIEYSIRIRAVNPVGSSETSGEITQRTLPTAPSLPRNVRISTTTLFSFSVTWDQPDPLNGPLFAYSIRHSQEGGSEQTGITISPLFTVSNVIRGSVYVFAVRAGTTTGVSILWGEYVEIRVQDGVILETVSASAIPGTSFVTTPTSTTGISPVPPSSTTLTSLQSTTQVSSTSLSSSRSSPTPSQTPISTVVPRDVSVQSLSANSAIVTWTAPVGSVEGFVGYRVFVSPAPPSTDGEFEVLLSQTSHFLSNLAYVTPYSISVSVYNVDGNGMRTAAVTLTTGEGNPTLPTMVQVDLLSSTTAQVTWQSPDPPNGVITQYDIRLLDVQTNIARTVTADPAIDGTSIVLTGLQTGRRYRVTVRARNSLLVGSFSEPEEFVAVFVPMVTTSTRQTSTSSDITLPPSKESTEVSTFTSAPVSQTPTSETMFSVSSTSAVLTTTAVPTDTTGLSQENIIAVAVIGGIIGLVLFVVLTAVVVVICRKCCAKPKKWDVYTKMNDPYPYKKPPPRTKEPDRSNAYLVPTRDSGSGSEMGYPLYNKTTNSNSNFSFGDQDSPHEASDFSDFDHLDDKDNESERFQGSNPRYVGVSDKKRLVARTKKKSTLPVVAEEVFDDPAYAQVTHPQEKKPHKHEKKTHPQETKPHPQEKKTHQQGKKVSKKSKVSNVGILTNEAPETVDTGDHTYADISTVKARKKQEREAKAAKRASRDTLDSQVTSSGMYSSRETIDSQRGGGARGRDSQEMLESHGLAGTTGHGPQETLNTQRVGGHGARDSWDTLDSQRTSEGGRAYSSRDTLDSNRFSDGYSNRDSRSTRDSDSLHTDDSKGRRRSSDQEKQLNHRWSGSGLPEHYF
jgi:hypothetical protein